MYLGHVASAPVCSPVAADAVSSFGWQFTNRLPKEQESFPDQEGEQTKQERIP